MPATVLGIGSYTKQNETFCRVKVVAEKFTCPISFKDR